MIKIAFLNYIKNFKWFFYVLLITGAALAVFFGILFLGIMLPIKNSNAEVYANIGSYISNYLATFNLTDVMSADFLQVFLDGLKDQIKDLGLLLKTFVYIELAVCGLVVMVGVKLATMLMRRAMKKTVKTKYTKKGIWLKIVKQLVSIGFAALYTVLTYIWFYWVFLLPLVSVVLGAFKTLYLSWRMHYSAFEKKKVFNLKNGLMLASSNLIMQYFNLAIVLIISFINVIAALAFAIPLFTYNGCINEITARGYFKWQLETGALVDPKEGKEKKKFSFKEMFALKKDDEETVKAGIKETAEEEIERKEKGTPFGKFAAKLKREANEDENAKTDEGLDKDEKAEKTPEKPAVNAEKKTADKPKVEKTTADKPKSEKAKAAQATEKTDKAQKDEAPKKKTAKEKLNELAEKAKPKK